MRLSVRARPQNALFRRLRFSSPAQTLSHLTQRRILHRPPYGKPHSVPGNSRKSTLCTGDATSTWPKGAFWTGGVTEKRTLRVGLTKGRTLHASGGCAESPFSPICVHSCIPTAARATGRGPRVPRRRRPHGPRDAQVPGPKVHATGAVTQPPTRTHEASFLIPICMMEARANQPDGIPQMVDMSNPTHCGKLLGMTMVATGVRNTLGMTEER